MLYERLCEGVLSRPAFVEARLEPVVRVASDARPLGQRMRLAIHGEQPIIALVVGLLGPVCPFDIARLIPQVVANAVERVFTGRSWADIRDECCERVAPLRAHGDAAPAVVLEIPVFWSLSAAFHSAPDRVFAGFRHVMCAALPCSFAYKASAAFGHAISESVAAHNLLVTARAAAEKEAIAAFTLNLSHHMQS